LRALSNESFTLNWDDVQLVPQPTNFSCWAAAASMVIGWRDQVEWEQERIVLPRDSWTNSWWAYVGLMVAVAGAIWGWHAWRAAP